MKQVKIAAVQMLSFPGQLQLNLDTMLELARQAVGEGAQLVVFPEASLTGYNVRLAAEIAVEAGCPEIQALEQAALDLGVTLCFGFIERFGECLMVTQETVGPDGLFTYSKTHLGHKETGVFTAGDSLEIAVAAGVPTGVHLCWESHFPEISTAQRAQGAQLLVIPFASGMTGESRIESWKKTLPARAFDNDAWVVAVNGMLSKDDGSVVGGGIAVFDNKGGLQTEYHDIDNHLLIVNTGGDLARDAKQESMRSIDYFSHRRPELYL